MSKRKPHNIQKRKNLIYISNVKNIAITWLGSDKVNGIALAEAWHIKTGKRVQITPTFYKVITTVKAYWQVCCVVLCRDQAQQQYAKTIWVTSKQPYKQSDLADYLNDIHLELWNTANSKHKIDLGWVAYPVSKYDNIERTDDEVIRLLEKRKCWDVISVTKKD